MDGLLERIAAGRTDLVHDFIAARGAATADVDGAPSASAETPLHAALVSDDRPGMRANLVGDPSPRDARR